MRNDFDLRIRNSEINRIPVVIFAYKRKKHLENLISSLLRNEESSECHLIVYIDGPKDPSELPLVNEVRTYAKNIHGFKKVKIIEQQQNMGLARSIIDGVSEVFQDFESAIFLEDDLRVSRNFLKFIFNSLRHYQNYSNVVAVSGYSYPLIPRINKPYFLLGAETWSFATWKEKWQRVDFDIDNHVEHLKSKAFKDKLDRYGFNFSEMLLLQQKNKIDSWGVRWWSSAVFSESYTLYPLSLIHI